MHVGERFAKRMGLFNSGLKSGKFVLYHKKAHLPELLEEREKAEVGFGSKIYMIF